MELFKKAWRGEEQCWKVFWIYGIAGGVAWDCAAVGLQHEFMLSPPLKFTFALFNILYLIWAVVSTYRCALNVGVKFFGYTARLLCLLFPLVFFGTFFAGGLQKGDVLIEAARCQRIAIDANYREAHPEFLQRCKKAGAQRRR